MSEFILPANSKVGEGQHRALRHKRLMAERG